MIIVLLANGFDQIEAITTVDILRREGFDVKTVGVCGDTAVSSCAVPVMCDITASEVDPDEVEAVIIPGGKDACEILDANPFTDSIISATLERGGRIGAICTAPVILSRRGLLEGRIATCHPDFKSTLECEGYLDTEVITSSRITTAKDTESSREFALELAYQLKDDKSKKEEKERKEKTAYGVTFASDRYEGYALPSVELLSSEDSDACDCKEEIQKNADIIIDTLFSFGIFATISDVHRGPNVTRYDVVPAVGTKITDILSISDDIALALAAGIIRMIPPIPGKSSVEIEVPNSKPETVKLRSVVESKEFAEMRSTTAAAFGIDIQGKAVVYDIAKLPHLIIAGAPAMGKTVCMKSILYSILYKARPDQVKFMIIDPRGLEFDEFNSLPHMLLPVISDKYKAAAALNWVCEEIERRYELFSALSVRNIDAYNDMAAKDPEIRKPLFKLVVAVDEYSKIMQDEIKSDVETAFVRLAQKARAAGIHLIINTRHAKAGVITGLIKANVPSRIALRLESNTCSRTVLDTTGAEMLSSKGDMLFTTPGYMTPTRIQGAYISDDETAAISAELSKYKSDAIGKEIDRAIEAIAAKYDKKPEKSESEEADVGYLEDEQFINAVHIAIRNQKISTTLIQRKLGVGLIKATEFMKNMHNMGLIGKPDGAKSMDVLISAEKWKMILSRLGVEE